MTALAQPPRFREYGVAIGDAVDVQPTSTTTFPLTLSLSFDPREAHDKGVAPELIRPFFYDQARGIWSTDGLTLKKPATPSSATVEFETMHLTVFRLGVPRGRPPLAHHLLPAHAAADQPVVMLGQGFSPGASQNVLTLGGAYVELILGEDGQPATLDLSDGGETLIVQDPQGRELDRAQLPAAPSSFGSWTRAQDGNPSSGFVEHPTVGGGRLFSPGTQASGDGFASAPGGLLQAPAPGDLAINEVLLAPPQTYLGDANGDGETNALEDEFVELVNRTTHPLRLGGCAVVTGSGRRRLIPEGTVLPGGMALLLFGSEDPAHPPRPAGPFGGLRFFPDDSTPRRLVARLSSGLEPGAHFLTVTALRQTSNPVTLQVLGALPPGQTPAFEATQGRLPDLGGAQPRLVRAADLDRDLDMDLLAVGQGGELLVLLNDGAGRFSEAADDVTLPSGRSHLFDVALADLTGDGAAEAVVGDTDAAGTYTQLLVLANRGDGHLHFASSTGTLSGAASAGPTAMAVGDVDGDGDFDVVVAMIGEPPIVFRGDGGTQFAHSPATDIIPQSLPAVPSDLALADVDNDGDLDLVLAAGRAGLGQASAVQLFLNDGSGAFLDVSGAQLPRNGDGVEALEAGDLDGDGDVDLVTVNGARPARVYRNDGTGRFTDDADAVAAVSGRGAALADFDGDGDPDLATAISPRDQVFLNDGAGRFAPLAALPQNLSGDHREASVLDMDRDGDLDLVLAQPHLALLRNTGVPDIPPAPNEAPRFGPIAAQEVAELQTLQLTLAAHVVDPDAGDQWHFGHLGLPPGAALNTSTGLFEWTPDASAGNGPQHSKQYPVTFLVIDLAGESGQTTVPITVLDVNQPPYFVGLGDQAVEEDQELLFDVVAEDPDGDALTLSAPVVPLGASFNPATGRFAWRPAASQLGDHDATFEVSDTIQSVRQTIRIHVGDVNHPPALGALQDQTVPEGRLLQVAFLISDADQDPVSVQVSPLPQGAAVFQQGGAWFLQWVPGSGQAGVYPLSVDVSDGVVASPVHAAFTVTVLNNPGLQPLLSQVGFAAGDGAPAQTPLGRFDEPAVVALQPGDSVGLDRGAVHPALVSMLELFHVSAEPAATEDDFEIWVSEDNAAYQRYDGPLVFSAGGNRLIFANLNIPQRYLKVHRKAAGAGVLRNVLPDALQASGAIPAQEATEAFLDELGRQAFLYFAENVNANGLVPDRVDATNGQPVAADIYSTAATGFWLATLPIAVERGWMTPQEAEDAARRTLEFYLGDAGGPVEGQFGFYYHFLNGDGTRFTQFAGDGVSILDSSILFAGALACGEYFGGSVAALATQLVDRADWDAFYDHGMNMLRLFWTPEDGFIRHLDYVSEGILAYFLAAGSDAHPIAADADLPAGPGDAYYALSQGNFGRILGRYGRDGRPLLQTFFGSLFAYLYPALLVDVGGVHDAFQTDWAQNAREAILANYRFAQDHQASGYGRSVWGISAADGPEGYQGRYGTPPLDPGAEGELHDGTVAPYALAGSLPFAAELALPALQHLHALQQAQHPGPYGLRDGINVPQSFFALHYLGIDQGALLLGLEQYRTGLIGRLVRQSALMQRAFARIGFGAQPTHRLVGSGPRSAHAYLRLDTTEHLVQTIQVTSPASLSAGDFLLELHPSGMDTALDERFVDAELAVDGQFVARLRFVDRRGDGTVDVGSVYAPISQALLPSGEHAITLTWVDGERWVQLEDVALREPTGRAGTQDTWQIGAPDGAYQEFGDERRTDDSYFVGDADLKTFEQALNVVDEPATDILFELGEIGEDRLLRLAAAETALGQPVPVEVSVNGAVVGIVAMGPGGEATLELSRLLLRQGWNHLALRHANLLHAALFVSWDVIRLEPRASAGGLEVFIRNVVDDQPSGSLTFGFAPPEGAVLNARQYLEIHYDAATPFEHVTLWTDNRNAPVHRFTGSPTDSAAGLVGEEDSTINAPLLWQVYDEKLPAAPAFTDTVEWAYVSDASEAEFSTPDAINYRTLVDSAGLGVRPAAGRSATAPVFLYLVVDFRGKPAQFYGLDELFIERFEQ